MATNSKIEWTHHTFNPWRGCTKVSDGCKNCYAETMSKRNPKVLGIWGDNGTRVVASESMWREPVKWNAAAEKAGDRHRVFCASLADVCEDRDDVVESRMRLMRLIEATPNLDWLLLTKRPQNFNKLFWGPEPWPKNIWVGTSCENQETADERIPHLLRVPAAVRFLSCEPLLGPIDLKLKGDASRDWDGQSFPATSKRMQEHDARGKAIHWIIAGGESGPAARPCNIAWISSIRDQCRAAGVPCFVKQLGARPTFFDDGDGAGGRIYEFPLSPPDYQRITHPKGGDMAEWPDDLRVRELPLVDDEPGDFTPENY